MDGKHREILDRLRQCEKDLAQLDTGGQSSTAIAHRIVKTAISDLESGDPDRVAYAMDFYAAVTSEDPDDIPRFLERRTQ